jgi:hypothetical protein
MDKTNNNIDENRILSAKDYYENLKCLICLELCNEPRLITCCETIACKGCITSWLSKKQTCPKCISPRASIQIPNRFINRLFDNIRVKCLYSLNGCKEVFSYFSVQEHERKCKYNDSKFIKCEKCNWEININKIANHDCIKHLSQIISDLNITDLSVSKNSCFLKCPIDKKRYVEEIINNLKIHEHVLQKGIRPIYECDICSERYHEQNSWFCKSCDFDFCMKCFDRSFGREVNFKYFTI